MQIALDGFVKNIQLQLEGKLDEAIAAYQTPLSL
jgi:hypothetical protein